MSTAWRCNRICVLTRLLQNHHERWRHTTQCSSVSLLGIVLLCNKDRFCIPCFQHTTFRAPGIGARTGGGLDSSSYSPASSWNAVRDLDTTHDKSPLHHLRSKHHPFQLGNDYDDDLLDCFTCFASIESIAFFDMIPPLHLTFSGMRFRDDTFHSLSSASDDYTTGIIPHGVYTSLGILSQRLNPPFQRHRYRRQRR